MFVIGLFVTIITEIMFLTSQENLAVKHLVKLNLQFNLSHCSPCLFTRICCELKAKSNFFINLHRPAVYNSLDNYSNGRANPFVSV